MAAADLDADAASQQEPQLVLLHGVGRREGACPPRVRDCSPGLQPEWRVGCAGAPHLLRLTAWELARRQRSHLRAGASQLRARAAERRRSAPTRWDGRRVEDFRGRYGDYLISKVSKVFPELTRQTRVDEAIR